jgi:Gas vesicle protein K/Gas vesicle protein
VPVVRGSLSVTSELKTQNSKLKTQNSKLKTLSHHPLSTTSYPPLNQISTVSSTSLTNTPKASQDAGLAPLLLTVVELIRQLMEAQIIRRMDEGKLSDEELERAGESLQKLEEQVVEICKIFEIDPADLNINLGEMGTLLPKAGEYYPGQPSASPSILELLDRLLNSGVVLQGSVDLGVAQLDLIHAKLQLVLTAKPI